MDKNRAFATPTYDDIERELLPYLSQRFASIEFAQQVLAETRRRLAEADILILVSDSKIDMCSCAMTVGKRLLLDQCRRTLL